MKIAALCFCLVSLSHGQTCTSRWSTFREVIEGPFCSQEPYDFSVRRTTKRRCYNERLYLKTTRSLLHPALINFFVFHQFSGFGSCSGSCYSKNVTVNVVYIRNLNRNPLTYDKKNYTFQYTNKNCDKLQWTTWSEMVSCQTSSHAVYARRRCVDCDGVDYPDRRYCYGNETKRIPCINLTPTDIDPSEHSNTNRSTNCNDQRCILFPNLTWYVIIGGVVVLIVLVIICKCKSKLRSSSPPKNTTSNSIKSNVKFVSAQTKHNATKDTGKKDYFSTTNLSYRLSNVEIQPNPNIQCESPLSTFAPSNAVKYFQQHRKVYLATSEIPLRPGFLLESLPSASTGHNNLISNDIYRDSCMLNTIKVSARPFNQAHQVTQYYSNCHDARPIYSIGLDEQSTYIEVE